MSKTKCLYHIVFGTKHREYTLDPEYVEGLYRYIWGALHNHQCFLLRINSMPDHVHMLIDLNPKIALSDLMESLKATSSGWLKHDGHFPLFKGWGRGYFAESVSPDNKDGVIEYIKGQQLHHGIEKYVEEMRRLYRRNGFEWYDNELQ